MKQKPLKKCRTKDCKRLTPGSSGETVGRTTAYCLSCSRQRKGSWKLWLQSYAANYGKEAALQKAKEQGVEDHISFLDVPLTATTSSPKSAQELALALFSTDGNEEEAFRQLNVPHSIDLLEKASKFEGLRTGDSTELGKMSYVVLARALLLLTERVQTLSPGALSQLVKPLTTIYESYGSGARASKIIINFGEQSPAITEEQAEQAGGESQ